MLMACWLYVIDRENWEIVKKERVLGVPPRNKKTIQRVKPGDQVVVYIKQEITKEGIIGPDVGGVFKVASEPYRETKRVFRRVTLPYRVKLEPVVVPERPKDFKPLIRKLEFIKRKKRWSGYLAGRMIREIPEGDCKKIVEYLKK